MAMSVTYTTFNGQIVYENRDGVESYYAPDTLGSTSMLVSQGGVVTDTFTYWPFGEILSHIGSSVTPFTYVGTLGYYNDLFNALIYIRARHYQQGLGNLLTVDPLWPNQPAYEYSGNRPSDTNDPSGLMTMKQCMIWCEEYLLSPREACMYCRQKLGGWSYSAADSYCQGNRLPPRMGPGRPGPVPRTPTGKWHDLPPFINGILAPCGYAMAAGTEPAGLIGGGNVAICGTVPPKLRQLESSYCSGDDIATNRGRYPGVTDTYWANYCQYLKEAIERWSEYCNSIIK